MNEDKNAAANAGLNVERATRSDGSDADILPPNGRSRGRRAVLLVGAGLILLIAPFFLQQWIEVARISQPAVSYSAKHLGGFVRAGKGFVLRESRANRAAPLRVIDSDTGATETTFGDATDEFAPVIAPDGVLCAVQGADNRARLWDTQSGKEISLEDAPILQAEFAFVEFRPDSQGLLIANNDELYAYDRSGRRTGKTRVAGRRNTPLPTPATPHYVHGGARILAQKANPANELEWKFVLLNSKDLAEIAQFGAGELVAIAIVSDDGKRLAAARAPFFNERQNTIQVWDLDRTAAPMTQFQEDQPLQLRFSPNGSDLFIMGGSAWASIADLNRNGAKKWKRQGIVQWGSAFFPSGEQLILENLYQKQLEICDASSGKPVDSFPCETGAFKLSADGKRLVVLETRMAVVFRKYGCPLWAQITLVGLGGACLLYAAIPLLLRHKAHARSNQH